jgi:acyl carrier protein
MINKEEKVKEKIKLVLSNNQVEAPNSISNNSSLRNDLEFSSMMLAELTVHIEDEFDVDIFEDGIVDTVDEIISKL